MSQILVRPSYSVLHLLIFVALLTKGNYGYASDNWSADSDSSTCAQLNPSDNSVEKIKSLTEQFLGTTQVTPVTAKLKAYLKDLSDGDLSKFKSQMQEACQSFKSEGFTFADAGYAVFKYVVPKATGIFGKYVVEEVKVAKQIIDAHQSILNFQGAKLSQTFPCDFNVVPIIKKYGFWRNTALSDRDTVNKIKEAALIYSDDSNRIKALYTPPQNDKRYTTSGSSACISSEGSKLDFIELLMENNQRLFVPVVKSSVVSFTGSTGYDISFQLLLEDGLYSITTK